MPLPAPQPEIIRDFLQQLYPDELHDGIELSATAQFVVWDRPGGTTWISSQPHPERLLAARAIDGDAYTHVCLHDPMLVKEANPTADMRRARGCAASATRMPGLWADVDHAQGDHKKVGLPPDLGAIERVLTEMELPKPTLAVNTGGGVHLYWLFLDPVVLATPEDRARMHELNQRMQQALRDVFAREGYTDGVDSAHDLARVLRAPGTVSHKYGKLVTRLAWFDGDEPRYASDALDELLPSLPEESAPTPEMFDAAAVASAPSIETTFELRRDAKPPERFTAALVMGLADPLLVQTWRRERKVYSGRGPRHGTLKDSSASSYTMSLVMRMLALDEWTDQELADACVAWRAMHGELMKGGRLMSDSELMRRIALTIKKARQYEAEGEHGIQARESGKSQSAEDHEDPHVESAQEELAERVAERPDGGHEIVETDERERLLGLVSDAIGTKVLRVEREIHEPGAGGEYTLVLPGNSDEPDDAVIRVHIGPAGALLNMTNVRACVLDGAGRMLARMKSARWDPIALAIRECAVPPPGGDKLHDVYRDLLREYLQRNLEESATSTCSAGNRRPVLLAETGRAAIKPDHLAEWAAMRPGLDQRTGRWWSRALRVMGLGESKSTRVDGTVQRRFVTRETAAILGVELESAE